MARSYLFIPGNVPRMLQNADVFEADALIIDLEDAIAAYEKEEARTLTAEFLRAHRPESVEVYVRINAEDPLFTEDLLSMAPLGIDGVVLPKTTLASLESYRNSLEKHNLDVPVIGLIETPDAFFELLEIARFPSLKGLLLGAEDLSATTGMKRRPGGEELLYCRSRLMLAAKAAGIRAIDTPWTSLDEEALALDIDVANRLGFDGKCAIHPNQVPAINDAFFPSEKELKEARRILKRHEETNSMRFSLDGKMIDKPVVQKAKALLQKAETYRQKGGKP